LSIGIVNVISFAEHKWFDQPAAPQIEFFLRTDVDDVVLAAAVAVSNAAQVPSSECQFGLTPVSSV
jgi:hypothetical protein